MTMDLMKIGDDVGVEIKRQNISMPENYSVSNALASAYLIIQETTDSNKKPAMEVCSPESIKQALLSMVVQGLNPIKNQCYFVVYGSKLVMQRSYMGAQSLAKFVNPNVANITAEIVYLEDQLEYEIINGKKIIKSHKQTLESLNKGEIVAAYAIALGHDDKVIDTILMVIDEIKKSWKQSRQKGIVLSDGTINPEKTHGKFMAEMCIRTVINKLCKPIINTSNDMTLVKAISESDEEIEFVDLIQQEVNENANQKVIDFKSSMATMAQARMITGMSNDLNQKEKMMENISGFMNREVKKISELTFDEANEVIDMLNTQLKELPDKTGEPDWM